jgi:hypothetical protein
LGFKRTAPFQVDLGFKRTAPFQVDLGLYKVLCGKKKREDYDTQKATGRGLREHLETQ